MLILIEVSVSMMRLIEIDCANETGYEYESCRIIEKMFLRYELNF